MVREEILKKMEEKSDNDDNDSSSLDDDNHEEQRDGTISENRNNVSKLAYDDEQRALRSAFLSSEDQDYHSIDSDNEDDDNGWLKKKKNTKSIDNDEIEKSRLEEIENLTKSDNVEKIIDPRGEVDDGEQFLFDFIKNKKWVDHDTFNHNNDQEESDDDKNKARSGSNSDGNESEGSLNELDKMDDFESRYNFRFEEANNDGATSGAGLSVVGYSRSSLSDTVRRKDESRKLKRQQRKERKLSERKEKEERLKRLKNAKKEELEERIKQIKGVLSDKTPDLPDEVVNEEVVAKLMDGDFDPDKFEELMSKMYNDDFYEKEDIDWKTDSDVKESLRKSDLKDDKDIFTGFDERDGYYEDEDEDEEGDNDNKNQERYDKNEMNYNEETGYEEYEEEEGGSFLEKKLKDRMMDELYKLDYEDIIGDMPTRFKYRNVEANRYGLRPDEILFSRDTTLKQFVSLKRMAPYDERGEYLPGSKKRKKFREMAKADYEELLSKDEKDGAHQNKLKDHIPADADNGQKDKKKRRRQKKGKKGQKENNEILETNSVTVDVDVKNGVNCDNEAQEKSRAKPGRKKRGKKVKKEEMNDNGQEISKETTSITKPKKTKKTKEKKQDLVSKSRLASYNF